MTLEITTPAVLFPTVSLLLLAYTNRFLALTAIVRQMDSSGEIEHEFYQVKNLKKRLNYIKKMQYFGVSSLLLCAVSMLWDKSSVAHNFVNIFIVRNSDFTRGIKDSFEL